MKKSLFLFLNYFLKVQSTNTAGQCRPRHAFADGYVEVAAQSVF